VTAADGNVSGTADLLRKRIGRLNNVFCKVLSKSTLQLDVNVSFETWNGLIYSALIDPEV
jgi:hypothetical protein